MVERLSPIASATSGIAASGVPRGEIFITTKLWNTEQGFDSTLAAFEKSIEALDTGAIDLYLIHWPVPARDLYLDTWRAFERIHAEGGTRSIGVSNFRIEDLERLAREAETQPTVNQIELHPSFQQRDKRDFLAQHSIHIECYSPLGHGDVLKDKAIAQIAKAHGKSVAQVVIRWHLEQGLIAIPRSIHAERLKENIDVFGFELSEEEMRTIAGLDKGEAGRTGSNPATASFLF